jgi:hypothetical protein
MMLSAKIISGLGLSNDPEQYVLTPRTAQKYKIINKKYEDILYKNVPPPPFGPPGSDLFSSPMRGRVKTEGEGREESNDPEQYVLSPRTAQKYEAMFKQPPYGQGPADMFPQVINFIYILFTLLSLLSPYLIFSSSAIPAYDVPHCTHEPGASPPQHPPPAISPLQPTLI